MSKQLIIVFIHPFHKFWFLLTKVGAERPRDRFRCRKVRDSPLLHNIQTPPSIPVIERGPGSTSPGVKRPGRVVDQLSSYNTDVRGARPLLLHTSSWYRV
jgi:hypothetical protein